MIPDSRDYQPGHDITEMDNNMGEPVRQPSIVLGIIAAIIGGCAGYFAFHWIIRQGFYALIVPAGMLGLAAGYGVRDRSQPFAIACGVAGLGLGMLTEWTYAPFLADGSFLFFVTHLHNKRPLTLIMLAIGTVISYRLALGPDRIAGPADDSRKMVA